MIELSCEYLSVWCIWLNILSCTRFRVNPHYIVAWMFDNCFHTFTVCVLVSYFTKERCLLGFWYFVGINAKRWISKRVLQENKVRQVIRKTNMTYPSKHTYVCVSLRKKCFCFRKFGKLYFLVTTVLRFAVLPYYRRLTVNFPQYMRHCELQQISYNINFVSKHAVEKRL